jgi:hypothetical protein
VAEFIFLSVLCTALIGIGAVIGWLASRLGSRWDILLLAAILGSGANGLILTAVALASTFASAGPNDRPLGILYPPLFAMLLMMTFGSAAIFTTLGCLIGFAARMLWRKSGNGGESRETQSQAMHNQEGAA